MTICKGCGIKLQVADPTKLGYTPKQDGDYCQRCFRLTHYDDLQISMKTGIDPDSVFEKINQRDCLLLWVVDLFDFEASMIEGLHRHLPGKEVIMVATKRDLLPITLGNEKLAKFIFERLKILGINLSGLVVTGKNIEEGSEEVMRAVRRFSKEKEIVVLGKANAGKSTLLNALMKKNQLTSSRYPGTTLDFNSIDIEGYSFVDTPGIEGKKTMLMIVDEKSLKTILPIEPIKPRGFQCQGDQSFALGGLVRIDVVGCQKTSVVFYISNRCNIHRGKVAHADELWKSHYGKMLSPIPMIDEFTRTKIAKPHEKVDVVVDGLGWISICGEAREIEVHYPKGINITFRKAMI